MVRPLILLVVLLAGCGPSSETPCDGLSWEDCEAASHCEAVQEESDEPDHQGFSCIDAER